MLKSLKLAAIQAAAIVVIMAMPTITFAQVTYDINFTNNAPTIDGVVSAGEWANAAAAEGNWRILRNAAGPLDAHNNRFQMQWDDTHLYLLTQSDFGGWTDNARDQFRAGANNVNIYFDPNLDGEAAQGSELGGPFTTPDGYQISVNQYVGSYSCTACSTDNTPDNTGNGLNFGEIGSGFSTFAEAHIDALFGNNAQWQGLRGTVMASINGAEGGVVEMAIPWADFDAPGLDANGLVTGLDIMGASPADGEPPIAPIHYRFGVGIMTQTGMNSFPRTHMVL